MPYLSHALIKITFVPNPCIKVYLTSPEPGGGPFNLLGDTRGPPRRGRYSLWELPPFRVPCVRFKRFFKYMALPLHSPVSVLKI